MGNFKNILPALLCGTAVGIFTLAALRNCWLEKQLDISFSHINKNRLQAVFTPLDKKGYKLLNGGVKVNIPESPGRRSALKFTLPVDTMHALHVDLNGCSGTAVIDGFTVAGSKKSISDGIEFVNSNGINNSIRNNAWHLEITDPAKAEFSLRLTKKIRPRTAVCYFAAINIFLLSAAAGYLAGRRFFEKVKTAPDAMLAAEGIFIAASLVIMILPVTGIDSDTVTRGENRKLNPAPQLFRDRRLNPVFFREFDLWYCDRFMGRSNGIDLYQQLFRPTGKAFAGKNGWYFSNIYGAVDAACNKTLYSQSELQDIKANLENLNSFLARRNCKLYLVLVPSKARVYREFFPDKYPLLHSKSKYEQLSEFLKNNCNVSVTDPLPEMLEAKNDGEDLYHRYGTHWTPKGAYLTYQKLRTQILRDFPASGNAAAAETLDLRKTFPAETELLMQLDIDPAKHCKSEELSYSAWKPAEQNLDAKPAVSLHIYNYYSRLAVPKDGAAKKRVEKMPVGVFYGDSFLDALLTCEAQHYREALFSTVAHAGDYRLQLAGSDVERLKPQVFVLLTNELGLDRLLRLDLPEK